jgi:hypothetical protein
MASGNNLERLLTGMKENLEPEMREGFARIEDRLSGLETRFDDQATRMTHQFGLLESEQRRIAQNRFDHRAHP